MACTHESGSMSVCWHIHMQTCLMGSSGKGCHPFRADSSTLYPCVCVCMWVGGCVVVCVCVCVSVCVPYVHVNMPLILGYDAATCKGARARVRDCACPGHPETTLKLAVLLLSESCPPPAPPLSTAAWLMGRPTA